LNKSKEKPMSSDELKQSARRPGSPASGRQGGAPLEYIADRNAEYVVVLNELYRVVHSARSLPAKYREISISVLLASRLYDRTSAHLGRALDAGATEEELLEALEVAQTITGAPTLLFGVDALREVVAERKSAKS
jgi:alkylhydroperoxidase/carboxymuconolactone decarboxylase family protein YurZ